MKQVLFLFRSTHDVIKAERSCLKRSIVVQVIPVPRGISSECGMSLEVPADRAPKVRQALGEDRIEYTMADRAAASGQ
jgi:hypothetical protein